MAVRTVRAWLLRFLFVVGAAGAVTVMHSMPVAAHERPPAASGARAIHAADMTADPMGDKPSPPADEHHGLEHLCLAILTAVAVSIALALVRLWRTISRTAEVLLPRSGERSPPPRRPPTLTRLCVLRL